MELCFKFDNKLLFNLLLLKHWKYAYQHKYFKMHNQIQNCGCSTIQGFIHT